ncbi:alpha/beta hydrolase [Halostagnicola sp. A-GB9-2]|uniref:alpha/beta fold hydrolase n=1 Tax=Halostagnicola sp. A-GB9-2 TaxID=3048066 RepID=UPI0024C00349|nr:alpha/beta hydrolase [Halostagnicola sp. A-GB9-2]MDJ1431273.1 alpha/beta hydrolase [Halostagnicola sp. A-GB9-2]
MTESTSPVTGEEMKTVTSADGTEIAFERTGSGPPLVLVHGGVCDHRFWELSDVRSAFADHCTVYAMDCRGVGESGDATERSSVGQPEASASGNADEYDLEREFEDVAAVVDAIDKPVTLLGHSSGALLSLEAALRTDNLHELILYEPPIAFGDHELYSDEVLAEMERLLKVGENEQVLVLFLQEIAQSTPEEIDAQRSASDWSDLVDAAHVWPRSLAAIGEYEFDADRFANMTTPTMLLSGSESPPLLKDATAPVNDALPNSRIVTFDGHAHEAMLTAPDRFIEAVLAVIRQ